MSAIQVILFKHDGKLRCQGEVIDVSANQLVVTTEDATASAISRDCWINVFCYPGEMHELYHEVMDLIGSETKDTNFKMGEAKIVPVFDQLISVIEQLKDNKSMMMKFVFIYCLSVDNAYFSGMLRYFLAHNNKILSLLESNFMNPWSVSQFAEELKMEVRKLNFFFYKNYGVSAKQWILERRLSFARQQLLLTTRKVADIALDSGFSNHAHFTDAFKKRYSCSPTELRATVA